MMRPRMLVIFAIVAFYSHEAAASEATIFFSNSGPEINHVQIIDSICGKVLYDSHFAAQDVHQVDHFCVHDAGTLQADFTVQLDDTAPDTQTNIPTNSNYDINTRQVKP